MHTHVCSLMLENNLKINGQQLTISGPIVEIDGQSEFMIITINYHLVHYHVVHDRHQNSVKMFDFPRNILETTA